MGAKSSKKQTSTEDKKVDVQGPSPPPPPQIKTVVETVYVPCTSTPSPPDELLPEPWTNVNINWKGGSGDDDQRKLLQEILNYKPNLKQTDLNGRIIFMGPVGSGKSSYLNTINSSVKGILTNRPGMGANEKSYTKKFQDYDMKTADGSLLKFRLCDTMGIEGEGYGLHINNIGKIIGGHVKDKYEFTEAEIIIDNDTDHFIHKPTLEQKTHCVALVISGSRFPAVVKDEGIMKKLKRIREEANKRDIPLAVIMTMVDILSEKAKDDAANVYHSKEVFEKVKLIEKELGIPRSFIFPVKNYNTEASLKPNIDILALYTCSRLLQFVNDYLEDQE